MPSDSQRPREELSWSNWRDWRNWSRLTLFGVPMAAAAIMFVAGIVFWGGFNTAMEATNTMSFCISCHEMRDNVYEEYKTTIHHNNRTGVQATCSDCHVPDPWIHKVARKIQASNEVFHHLLGSISTPEKFDKKRLKLARNVWYSMKATDSRECRNCHTIESMNPEFQRPRARKQHLAAMKAGNTCIDCHKGIAHKNVRDKLPDEELEELEKPLKQYVRAIPESYIEGLKRAEAREAEEEAKKKQAKADVAARIKQAVASATAKLSAEHEKALAAATQTQTAQADTTAKPPAAGTPSKPPGSGAASGSSIDWNGVEAKTISLFYPGQASFEWVQYGKDHGGARAFLKAGDRCAECHAKEVKDMGAKIVSGEKAEPTPIPGKRAYIDVAVQAAHDDDNLHLRFQWQNAAHTPAPFVDGGKMDPDNQVKLAFMIAGDGIDKIEQAGCWVSCHHDARYMPHHLEADAIAAEGDAAKGLDLKTGVTKYTPESRSKIEIKGRGGKKRGGWANLKDDAEVAKLKETGAYLDLLRFVSSGKGENGHILKQRIMTGGAELIASGALEGDTWTVTMSRPLKSDKPGDISLEPGKLYTIGIAIHDDYTSARFHHVSLEYRMGLDNAEAEINVVKK